MAVNEESENSETVNCNMTKKATVNRETVKEETKKGYSRNDFSTRIWESERASVMTPTVKKDGKSHVYSRPDFKTFITLKSRYKNGNNLVGNRLSFTCHSDKINNVPFENQFVLGNDKRILHKK